MTKRRMLLVLIFIVTLFGLQYKNAEANDNVYTKSNVNIRKKPNRNNRNSKSVGMLYYGESIKRISKLTNGWTSVLYKNHIRYIKSKYLVNTKPKEKLGKSITHVAPSGHHQKSYMDRNKTTDKSSQQYKFLEKCYIGRKGIYQYKLRYCAALGSYYCKKIGTKFDLVLNNGKVIPCVLAEQKRDRDTDSTNRYHIGDGSIVEFVVNTKSLSKKVKLMGDVGYASKGWDSEIKYIKIYK